MMGLYNQKDIRGRKHITRINQYNVNLKDEIKAGHTRTCYYFEHNPLAARHPIITIKKYNGLFFKETINPLICNNIDKIDEINIRFHVYFEIFCKDLFQRAYFLKFGKHIAHRKFFYSSVEIRARKNERIFDTDRCACPGCDLIPF